MGKKIGRNEKCPCGSGLKYKKCCNNSMSNEDLGNKTLNSFQPSLESEFPNLLTKVANLKPILQRYKFNDLAMAIYCLNIELNNRAFLENQLALNQVLIDYIPCGDEKIEDYEEFIVLYELIKKYLSKTILDDEIISDFGEVKLTFDDCNYEVIIGTGYEQTFGYYQFIPNIVKESKNECIYKLLLEFNEHRIKYFADINKINHKRDFLLTLPTKLLFERTKQYFKFVEEQSDFRSIIDYFNCFTVNVTNKHFVEFEARTYPLFNTSILIDFYSCELNKISDLDKTHVTDFSIIEILMNLTRLEYHKNLKKDVALFPVKMTDNNKELTKIVYTFLLKSNDNILLGINGDRYTEEEINDEMKFIKSLHSEGDLTFGEIYGEDKSRLAIKIPSSMNIKFIVYNNIVDPRIVNLIIEDENKDYLKCSAVDLVYLLSFMDTISQLSRFHNHMMNLTSSLSSYGGISDYFFVWKNNNEMIEKGAISYSYISIGYGNSDNYVFDYYNEFISNFPEINSNSIFNSPYVYTISKKDDGFYEYVHKLNRDFGGLGQKYKNNCFTFYSHNLSSYDKETNPSKIITTISLIDDLNLRTAKNYNNWFEENNCFDNTIIQLMFLPMDYAKTVDNSKFTDDTERQYVYSDMNVDNKVLIIRYCINEEKLYRDLEKIQDRSVESTYYLELLKPLEEIFYNQYQQLKLKVISEIHLPKGVSVVAYSCDYKWTDNPFGFYVKDETFRLVKKDISKICNNIGIQIGDYHGKDSNRIIRLIQKELILYFDNLIIKLDRLALHKILLSKYSTVLHQINLHKKRYESFENIDEVILLEIQNKTIEEREEAKHHLRVIEYVIETNLYQIRNYNELKPNKEELEYIFAFSNWIVVLSDTADICYKSSEDQHIQVCNDFVINIIGSDQMKDKLEGLSKRVYDNNDTLMRADDIDNVYLDEVIKSFKEDTDIEFNKFLSMIDIMSLQYGDNFAEEVLANVYKMEKKDFISFFVDRYDGNINKDEVESIFKYLTLDPLLLKTKEGNTIDYLPINEREYRPDRFNLKPLIQFENLLFFSPIVMSDLLKRWKFGITDFYIPVESGLEKTVNSLLTWKKRYEDLIVEEVFNLFKDFGVKYIWKEAELHKLDKKNNHPLDLGDYDVLAYEEENNKLWVIECKYINKVGSIHENLMQQYNFFKNKKYDEKFQKRIKYITKNGYIFLNTQGIVCDNDMEIFPLMITNKVFISRYKEIEFDILTFLELKKMLEDI